MADKGAEIELNAELEGTPGGAHVSRSSSHDASETGEQRSHNVKGHGTYWCPKCAYASSHKGHYTHHLVTHTSEKPYTCPECQRRFNRKDSLVRHKYTHSEERHLSCPDCPERFKAKGSLNRHVFFRHIKELKSFVCETCGKRVNRPDSLARHERIHTGDNKRGHSCSKCFRTFRHWHVLKRHEKTMHRPPAAASPHDESALSLPGEAENL